MEKIYDKLVRDNIPNIIISNGATPVFRALDNEEFWDYLLKKDTEELEEVKTAHNKEEILKELGDKLELLRTMAEYNGFNLEDVINAANIKSEKNGTYNKRLLLIKVIENN